jgi:hypothetical protein
VVGGWRLHCRFSAWVYPDLVAHEPSDAAIARHGLLFAEGGLLVLPRVLAPRHEDESALWSAGVHLPAHVLITDVGKGAC